MKNDWMADVYRLIHLDTHFDRFDVIYKDFDADEVAQMYQKAGFQMVSFMAFDGPSYYPTKIGRTHAGLTFDFFGEFSAALKRVGIRVVAYVSFGDMGFDYEKLEKIGIPRLIEIAERYDVDGFFLDGPAQPYLKAAAYRDPCHKLYDTEVGGEFPDGDDHPGAFAFRRWANKHMDAFMDKVHDGVSAIKPDIVIIYNGHWMMRYPVTPPDYIRYISWDVATPKISGVYSCSFSIESRHLACLPNTHFGAQSVRGRHWFEFSLREPESFLHECAVMLAGGGRPWLSDNPYPSGRPDPALMEIYEAVNERTRSLEPYISGCRPVKDVAVLHSADAVWSKAPYNPVTSWTSSRSYHSVAGVHKALVEGHVQFLIPNGEVLVDTIGEYNALVLADQRILNDRQVEAIRNFVKEGGILIATGETGTRDTDNRQLDNFSIADVLGVDYERSSNTDVGYLRFDRKIESHGIPAADIPVLGNYVKIRTNGAEKAGDLVGTYENHTDRYAAPAEETLGPAVTINHYGKGKALYCAVRPFDAYYAEDMPVLRKIALWMLELVYPPKDRKIVLEHAPLNVEFFYNERENEKLVHLINYSADRREGTPGYAQDFPIRQGIEVRLRLDEIPESVSLVPEERKLDYDYSDGWLTFKAEPLHIHSVYRIKIQPKPDREYNIPS